MAEIYSDIDTMPERAKNLISVFQKIDHTQTENLRKLVRKILRSSLNEDDLSENLKPSATLGGTFLGHYLAKLRKNPPSKGLRELIRKRYEPKLLREANTKRRLNLALKKLEFMQANELFSVIRVNREECLESVIDYLLTKEVIILEPQPIEISKPLMEKWRKQLESRKNKK